MTYEISLLAKNLPAEAATRHFCFIGTTGSGKTLLTKMLANSVLHHVGLGINHRALIYDAKKDMHSLLYKLGINLNLVHTLNPFDERCIGWDIAQDIDSPANALELANILIPQKEESQPFFTDAARDLLSGVILSFIINYPRTWTFRDVLLTMRNSSRICEVLNKGQAKKYVGDRALYFANDRTGNSILATLRSKLSPFEIIAALWEKKIDKNTGQSFKRNKISLRDWINNKTGSILLLGASETNREALDIINRVLFKRITQLVLDQPEDSSTNAGVGRTWFFLDELRMLGNVNPTLSSLFTQGRSKGACILITLQDIDGLRAIYGEAEANEILAQCNTKVILQLSSSNTAKWASELAGKMRDIEKDRSESWGTYGHTAKDGYDDSKQEARVQISESEKLVERDRILAGEFMDKPSTNKQNGMYGFYMTPYSDDIALRQGKKFRCQPSTIDGLLIPKTNNLQAHVQSKATTPLNIDFYLRDPNDQFLESWSLSELQEKGLTMEADIKEGNPKIGSEKSSFEKEIKKYIEEVLEKYLEDLK